MEQDKGTCTTAVPVNGKSFANCSKTPVANLKRETLEALMIVVYDSPTKFFNEMVKNKGVVNAYGKGQLLGHSDCIRILHGSFKDNQKIALLSFGDDCSAKAYEDTKMRPCDGTQFGGLELYVVPCANTPCNANTHPIGLFEAFDLQSSENFENYMTKAAALVKAHGGQQVVGKTTVAKWSTKSKPHFITLSQWKTEEQFKGYDREAQKSLATSGAGLVTRVLFHMQPFDTNAHVPPKDFIKELSPPPKVENCDL